jgi:protein ImuB
VTRAARAGARVPDRVLVLHCAGWPEQEPDQAVGRGPGRGPGTGPGEEAAGPAARAFEPVLAAVGEFCPKVEILRPGTCAIGVRGPARYFGGEEVLAEKITTAVREAGFACQAGVADGLFAAELAARTMPPSQAGPAGLIVPRGDTPAFLAGQPVGVLGRPELEYLLPRLGIATLGELAALPAAEAASRFGAAGALAHRLARGLDPRPLVPRPPAADLSVSMEFDPPAEQAEPVVFTAKSLAESMHAGLAARGLACVRVQVLVRCEDGREITRFWRHDGLLSGLAVAERVRWQLDAWRTDQETGPGQQATAARQTTPGRKADPGAGGAITLLKLIPDQLVRATGRQLGLWGDAVVTDRVARSAVRVQAMLGHGAVTRPVLAGGRRPGDQVLLVPFGDAGTPARPADRPWPGKIPAPAPATVYPAPLPAWVTDASGEVVTVTGRAQLSAPPAHLSISAPSARRRAITAWAGPWPVNERWWDPAQACRQARFQLVTDDGRAWLAVVQDGRWLLEGSYD